jgi:hypothetical protein
MYIKVNIFFREVNKKNGFLVAKKDGYAIKNLFNRTIGQSE